MHRRRFVASGALAAATAFLAACATGRNGGGNPYYSGPPSDHFDGVTFFNPGGTPLSGFGRLLRWQLGREKTRWPEAYPSPHHPAAPVARLPPEALRVTMVGHATLLIQTGGLNILTDPVWSERASPVRFAGPRRVNPPGIAFDSLPPVDLVLLTHNHYDHLDIATLARLQATHDPLVVTPLGNDTIVRKDVPAMRLLARDWGDVVEHVTADGRVRVHLEPCHHWSARGFGDRRMALWAAFVIESAAGRTYHVGDTGYHDGINYRDARARHGAFRLAVLPVGAYEPRWFMAPQHQNPAEAVLGFRDCGATFACGHHWGTFQLTDEGIEAPLGALDAALAEAGIEPGRFRPLRPGEAWDVPVDVPANDRGSL
jgi:L-ascorbate metabolism protein UlaG (beta-lactamase superfamily)